MKYIHSILTLKEGIFTNFILNKLKLTKNMNISKLQQYLHN